MVWVKDSERHYFSEASQREKYKYVCGVCVCNGAEYCAGLSSIERHIIPRMCQTQ